MRGIYRPPAGELLDITARFTLPDGKVTEMPAWKLLRQTGSESPLDRPINWVYVGVPAPAAPGAADAEGTIICLSNFLAAVIDVPFESTSANADLEYEIDPKAVPPVGTAAELIIRPTGKRTEPKQMVTEVVVRKGQPILLDGQPVDLEKFRQTVTRMPADIRLALLRVDAAETFGRALELYNILTDDALMTVQMSVLEPGAAAGRHGRPADRDRDRRWHRSRWARRNGRWKTSARRPPISSRAPASRRDGRGEGPPGDRHRGGGAARQACA